MTQQNRTGAVGDGQERARPRKLDDVVVTAFLSLLRTRHPDSITFRDIAAEAGISHMAPYRHFKSRRDLLDRVADLGFGMLAAALEEVVLRHPKEARRQILEASLCYYRFAVSHPGHAQVMFGAGHDFREEGADQPALAATRAVLLRIIHNCQLAGELPRALDEKVVLGLFWAQVHGFTLLWANHALTGREVGAPEDFVATGVEALLAGLAAR